MRETALKVELQRVVNALSLTLHVLRDSSVLREWFQRLGHRAVETGKLLEPDSELGESFADFAAQLMDQPGVKTDPGKRRFLEFLRPSAAVPAPRATRPHQKELGPS